MADDIGYGGKGKKKSSVVVAPFLFFNVSNSSPTLPRRSASRNLTNVTA